MKVDTHFRNPRKGGALITVIILCTVLLLIIASLLKSAHNAKLINHRQALWLEAKNAAESAVEYGLADLARRLNEHASLPRNEMAPGVRPLTLPASASTFLNYGHVSVSDVKVVGGPVNAATVRYIDPDDVANAFDPLKGTTPVIREIEIYGTAKATSPHRGGDVTAYCMERLQVRDSALFSHAIFYNMDLEFSPGPTMDITGPVHTNNDLYMSAKRKLYFHASLTAAGKVYRETKTSPGSEQGGDIYAHDSSSNWVDWPADRDSNYPDWEGYAANRWDGNVQTAVHSVRQLNPAGLPPYIPDDPGTTADERRNYGYSLIEPQLGTSIAFDKDTKGELVESQKFSARAGLIIRVTGITQPDGWKLFRYQTPDPNSPVSTQPTGNNLPVRDNSTGLPVEIEIPQTPELRDIIVNEAYSEDASGVQSGLYDRREGSKVPEDGKKHLVIIDIEKLRKTLDDHVGGYASSHDGKAAWGGNYEPEKHFNGLIYVEMPLVTPRGSVSHTSRADKIRVSKKKYALFLKNGMDVPNPSWNPANGREAGFTIATNGPVYVHGHYNSDGNEGTGSSSNPDAKPSDKAEVPAAIIGDAITVLSKNFDKKKSKLAPGVATFNEVSAALVAGQAVSIPGTDHSSGGVHNFPRLLESWHGRKLRYRGSMVALYESEVNDEPMWLNGLFKSWYGAPERDFGFHQFFNAANFPPGTPYVRDLRRVDFRDLTKQEYETAIANLSY
ncbi:MAG: hypothetical protein D6781_12910 [Verrucomicrobia bacterium]|nr:MAG: hypothetical protein D6781_12910 [Verrucomicrobiota bacterium]